MKGRASVWTLAMHLTSMTPNTSLTPSLFHTARPLWYKGWTIPHPFNHIFATLFVGSKNLLLHKQSHKKPFHTLSVIYIILAYVHKNISLLSNTSLKHLISFVTMPLCQIKESKHPSPKKLISSLSRKSSDKAFEHLKEVMELCTHI